MDPRMTRTRRRSFVVDNAGRGVARTRMAGIDRDSRENENERGD